MASRKGSKEQSIASFVKALQRLDEAIKADLQVPSLRENPPRLEGFAFRYTLLLPLLSATGSPVFTGEHLAKLYDILNNRFGGCLVSASSSHPPLYGFYQPEGREPEKDYHTQAVVFANPIEPANQFITELKRILRSAPLVPQEEILVERIDVWLM